MTGRAERAVPEGVGPARAPRAGDREASDRNVAYASERHSASSAPDHALSDGVA
jgi:hypothetical protein